MSSLGRRTTAGQRRSTWFRWRATQRFRSCRRAPELSLGSLPLVVLRRLPNFFIVDGSSLVTGRRNRPTMTIQALASRAAVHVVRSATNGEVKGG